MELSRLLDQTHQLPTIPKVVQTVIDSFDAPHINTDALANTLANDQVLTAKVLRLANSAHYGSRRQVASVNTALVTLGLNTLRTLVLASGLTGAFRAPEGFDLKQFWRNSFSTASLCRWLASFTPLDPETAFTCGMMHNIGGLLIHIIAPDNAALIDRVQAAHPHSADPSAWDFTDLGAALAERWRFPDRISQAIRHQLAPERAHTTPVQDSGYAHLVFLANYIVTLNSCKDPSAMLAQFPRAQALAAGIDADELIDKLPETRQLSADFDLLLND